MTGKKANPQGERSKAVIANLAALIQQNAMTYTELSRRLQQLGHPLPPIALRRLLQGDRQITVDDAEYLGQVFGLSIVEMVDDTTTRNYRAHCLRWLLAEAEYLESIR